MSPLSFKKSLSVSIFTCSLSMVLLVSPNVVLADQVYGPVRANDTLGKIVNRFYVGPNRSSFALMKTIVANNPRAFVNGNMNLLKRDALLTLPGDDWLVNEPRFISPETVAGVVSSKLGIASSAPSASTPNTKQMQQRIIFLEAERTSLIRQVEQLKQTSQRLLEKVQRLEKESLQSDEQLRLLDAEIIRLTQLLENKQGVPLTSGELSTLQTLQQKLHAVQQDAERLRSDLSQAQADIADNDLLKRQADKKIIQLTQENQQLQHLLRESQPGVHYFGNTGESPQVSVLGGKLQLPLWGIILGGAALSLMLITLLSTRRKTKQVAVSTARVEPESVPTYDTLLETPCESSERGFAQVETQPEENVFKMFDEGSLEMDLKLDMAEAYLEVADFDSARLVLEEVMEGGSELQQRKAARLMKQAA